MTLQPIDLHRLHRAMGDPGAITVANDNRRRSDQPTRCSWHTTAQTIALLLIGSAIVGVTIYAGIA